MEEQHKKSCVFWIYPALALVCFFAYEPVRHSEFVNYDDETYVTKNEHVLSGLTYDNIKWAFTTAHASNWHPLTWLSHMADCELFGKAPHWHHLTNLLLHIISTLLLFAIFKRMTGAVWCSVFVAAAFGLHPLHVESVAWISERKDVLSTFFWMLSMWAYIRYVEQPRLARYLLSLVLFVLGLMAKPMLVTLPFVLLLLDYWPMNRLQKGTIFSLVKEKIPFFFLSLVSSAITFFVQQSGDSVASVDKLGLTTRIANAIVSYGKYIEKMMWPSKLAVFYPHLGEKLPMWQVIAAALLMIGISICVIRFSRKYKYLTVGWLWYLGTLIPVIGLVQVGMQALADRYTYIPLTGLFIIIAWGANDISLRWRFRSIVLTVLSIMVFLSLTICTRIQVGHWRNALTLCEQAVRATEDNWGAYGGLGDALKAQGRLEEAIDSYRETLRLRPNDARTHNNLGNALLDQNKLQEAIEHYQEALRAKPDYATAHQNLGEVLKLQGKLDEAIKHFHEALHLEPENFTAWSNLGNVYYLQGKFNEAVKCHQEALKFSPDYAEVHNNLANALFRIGQIEKAAVHYEKAIELKPNEASFHNNFGNVLAMNGRYIESIEHYKISLKIRPDDARTLANLVNALMTSGMLEEAESKYIESLKISNENAAVHFALGICLERQDKISEAIKEYKKALSIKPDYNAARQALEKYGSQQ